MFKYVHSFHGDETLARTELHCSTLRHTTVLYFYTNIAF
jgi:hypothetical protein